MDIIPANDEQQTVVTLYDGSVIHAATGRKYSSIEEFYDYVGNEALQNDPSLIYYTHVNYTEGVKYIYSNKDSAEVVQSIQSASVHIEPEDVISAKIPETINSRSSSIVSAANQGKTPYSAVCQIVVHYVDANYNYYGYGFGTGFFISPYHVATNAHCLKNKTSAGAPLEARSIEVYFSYTDSDTNEVKFGVVMSEEYSVCSSFSVFDESEPDDAGADYGVIKLYADFGNLTSFFKINP